MEVSGVNFFKILQKKVCFCLLHTGLNCAFNLMREREKEKEEKWKEYEIRRGSFMLPYCIDLQCVTSWGLSLPYIACQHCFSCSHQHSLTAVKIGQVFDRSRFASGSPSVLLICMASQKLLCVRNSSGKGFWLCDLGVQWAQLCTISKSAVFYLNEEKHKYLKLFVNVTLFQTNNCSSAQIIHKNFFFLSDV